MRNISLEELLEAGCHFGHQVTRQNPKARDYVFEARDNIHIIDLEKTKEGLEEAGAYVKALAAKDGTTMLVLGAKRQASQIVRDQIEKAQKEGGDGLYSVTNHWVGGIMTNLTEVTKNFKRLEAINKLFADEYERQVYTKKELLLMEREKQKLEASYSGIATMTRVPDCLFVIDTHLEYLAVREAKATGVKTVGITDTNADPTLIDYAIPANDDAVGSIELITRYILDAWVEGKKQAVKSREQAIQNEAKAASDAKKAEEVKAVKVEDARMKAVRDAELAKKEAVKKAPKKAAVKKKAE